MGRGRCSGKRRVAGEAFRVVVSRVAHDLFMRIVAGYAANAFVGAVEALAVCKSIRLEANVRLAAPVAADNCFPGTMALAAIV